MRFQYYLLLPIIHCAVLCSKACLVAFHKGIKACHISSIRCQGGAGLSGEYQVKVLVQEGEDAYKIYETGVTVSC